MSGEREVESSQNEGMWRFSDGVLVDDELRSIDISKIRAVCDQQCRTKWSSIASRERLYQFLALSDKETQHEMRLKALSMMAMDSGHSENDSYVQPLSTSCFSATVSANVEDDTNVLASTFNSKTTGKRKRGVDESLTFSDGKNIHDLLHYVPVTNLEATCRLYAPHSRGRTRMELYEAISQESSSTQELIRNAAIEGMGNRVGSDQNSGEDAVHQEIVMDEETTETLRRNGFMKPPTKEVVDAAIADFIDRTGNAALAVGACAVCARETSATDLSRQRLESMPNPHRLIPMAPHAKHDIFKGMLLHPPGVLDEEAGDVCAECLRALRSDKIPKFALANGMWIGRTPHELAYLTLPERILIAKFFPAAYIIKLFPKKKGARYWDKRQMYSGVKGNVSTYQLDQNQISSMIDGTIMPQPAIILAATIGITFVGPKNLPERCLPDTFRVRRTRVKKALEWLKTHNPLFSNITISASRLSELPEDDVPYELMSTVKHSTDLNMLHAEHDGYVPAQEVCEGETDRDSDPSEDEACDDDDTEIVTAEPTVLPLSHLGVVDIDGVDVSETELMAHALVNACQTNEEENYMVRRGSAFVNEYARVDPLTGQRNDGGPSDANHLLGSFPTLFPFGQGGFEIERRVNVPYEAHVRWALQYEDRRFRTDPHFPFQVFGVCQKRQVCRASVLQMKKGSFFRNQNMLSTLSANDLTIASQEETRGVPFSNPAVRLLRSQLSAVKTKVQGSDESRTSIRSKIWGTNLLHNPPSLWVTINPADTQDPIAQVIAGVDIDLDQFCKTAGPDSVNRAVNMAQDPYASAKFFHLMIETILEVLVGLSKEHSGKRSRKEGIFGTVRSYVGAVEAQGRGSLHLHLLLWLSEAPTAREMKHALLDGEVREKIKQYIKSTIRADLGGKGTGEVVAMRKTEAVSYSRPLDPRNPGDVGIMESTEAELARSTQLHQCSYSNCLKVVKGRTLCKRRAPFPLAVDDWIDSTGGWGPKRMCGFLNNWNPPLMMTLRANHDAKLIMNGAETNVLTWYITNYAGKKQQRSSNVSALLAKRVAFHTAEEKRRNDLLDVNKRLIQRCANTLTRDREFSGPEIISYLMGWGDRYESHRYVAIYPDAMIAGLKERYPGLRSLGRAPTDVGHIPGTPTTNTSTDDRSHIITMVSGVMSLKDQLHEYKFRGEEMVELNFLDFMLDTYDAKASPSDEATDPQNGSQTPRTRSTGRIPNQRVFYREGFSKVGRCRVYRTDGHETLPQFVGRWFPRNDRPKERELYCAAMLALLRPWCDLSDLKRDTETFDEVFQRFLVTTPKKNKNIIENIQYYYECYDGAKRRQEAPNDDAERTIDFEGEACSDDLTTNTFFFEPESAAITEEDIEMAHESKVAMRERFYAEVAMNTAIDHGVFSESKTHTVFMAPAEKATADQLKTIQTWAEHLKTVTRREAEEGGPGLFANVDGAAPKNCSINNTPEGVERCDKNRTKATLDRPKRDLLNEEQRRAHDIIEDQLRKRLADEDPPQLRMLVLGHGGTGKSMLIGAITETFSALDAENKLAKCATSGVAAVIIGGQTLHSWAGIPINKPRKEDWVESSSPSIQKRRKENIKGRQFLITDEVSMCTKQMKYRASEIVSKVRASEGVGRRSESFGGMDIIDFGDFHQFPPVGNPTAALYCDRPETDDAHALKGRSIFVEYDKVVILREQMRVTDDVWTGVLSRLRVGDCTEDDISEVQKLVLSNADCDVPDFASPDWRDATLITPRNAAKDRWNSAALERQSRTTGNRKYIFSAEDTLSETGEEPDQRTRLGVASLKDDVTKGLKRRVEMCVGMKAMVVLNIATEADLANGTRGTVKEIVLDPRESCMVPAEDGAIHLRYPPPVVFFQPDMETQIRFEGVPEGLIPISPSKVGFSVTVEGQKIKLERRQTAIVPGYAFTDYKAQGQTLETVIIDISKPPTGKLSPFSVYVALSRSRGRKTIRILREFDPALFMHHPSEDLRADMARLEGLDERTKTMFEEVRYVVNTPVRPPNVSNPRFPTSIANETDLNVEREREVDCT